MTTNQKAGQFVWRELMTHDVEASTRFYSEVFGWKVKVPKEMPNYQEFYAGEKAVGGMMVMGPEMNERATRSNSGLRSHAAKRSSRSSFSILR